MKTLLLALVALGVCAHFYLIDHPQQVPSFLHHQAEAGVYYLRASYPYVADGSVQHWAAGQELHLTETAPSTYGAIVLTDSQHTAEVPLSALTRDVEEATAIQQASAPEQAQAAVMKQQLQERARAMSASQARTYVSPLEQPARPVGGLSGYYNGYYYAVPVSTVKVTTTASPTTASGRVVNTKAATSQVQR